VERGGEFSTFKTGIPGGPGTAHVPHVQKKLLPRRLFAHLQQNVLQLRRMYGSEVQMQCVEPSVILSSTRLVITASRSGLLLLYFECLLRETGFGITIEL
jgi:hypothetical protein